MNGVQFGGESKIGFTVDTSWTVQGLGDLNNDGNEDVLWRDSAGKSYVWLMNAQSISQGAALTSSNGVDMLTLGQAWQVKEVADFNGDGKADILWRNELDRQAAIWYMDGKTVTSGVMYNNVAASMKVGGVGDFDGDGKVDIFWRDQSNGANSIWREGKQSLSQAIAGTVDFSWKIEAVADFSGDGKSDVFWRNAQNQVGVWEMDGAQILKGAMVNQPGLATAITLAADWEVVGAEYLGSDGRADLVWRHQVTKEWAVWEMNTEKLATGTALTENLAWRDVNKKAIAMTGRSRAIDEAGNEVGTALGLGQLSGKASYAGAVDPWDRADVYGFTLDGAQMVRVSLDGMDARAEDNNLNLQVVKWDNTVVARSENLRSQAEELMFSGVAGQTYYVKVVQAGTKDFNQYRLGLEKVPMATLSLTMETDTGNSNSDGITKDNRPEVEGTGPVGSVLRLYAQAVGTGTTTQPEVFLGSVTVGSSGEWKIRSPELADGRYALSAKRVLLNGTEQNIAEAREIAIDTLRPNLTINGIYDGIAYEVESRDDKVTQTFSGKVSDADAGVVANFVQNGASQALTVSVGNINNSTVTLSNRSLVDVTQLDTSSVEETLKFEAIDRAGNRQELDYRATLIKLAPLTDESELFPDAPTGLDDRIAGTNTGGSYAPTDLSGGRIYIGQGGAWGYSGGGTGGSSGWQPPSGGPSATGSDPLLPVSDPELNKSLNYLDSLRQILTTARDALSKHSKTAAKKEALRQDLEMLMEMGRLVEAGGLYSEMQPMLYGVMSYVGGMTRRAAILEGWKLAKNLAKDAVLTKVKIAHTNLFGISLVAMKNNNVTVNVGELRTATENLLKSYARLNVATHAEDRFSTSYSGANFLDAVWRMGGSAVQYRDQYGAQADAPTYENKVIQFAVRDLEVQSKGSIDVLEALKVSDRMLQVAPRVSQLSKDAYGYTYNTTYYNYAWGTKQSSLRTAGFLDKLMDFSFEIARSNPALPETPKTVLQTSEWVETLWQGKTVWTNKEKESVSLGMGEWMDGFRFKGVRPVTNDTNTLWSNLWVNIRNNRDLSEKAFDYAGRLMQAARAIDDVNLKPAVKKADFLSHLVNLGGAYAISNPNTSSVSGLFLDTVWGNSTDSQKIGVELTNYLKKSVDFVQKVAFDGRLLYTLKSLSDIRPSETWKNASDFKKMLDWGSSYWQDAKLQDENLIVHDPGDLFKEVFGAKSWKESRDRIQLVADRLAFVNIGKIINDNLIRVLYVDSIVDVATQSGFYLDDTAKVYARRHIQVIMEEALTKGRDGIIVNDNAQIAYILATAAVESSMWGRDNFKGDLEGKLIERSGNFLGTAADKDYFFNLYEGRLGNRPGTDDYYTYRGRGYVQLTGRENYGNLSKRLRYDSSFFIDNPSYVQEPGFAAPILIAGIMESLFTYQGNGLADFVSSGRGLFNWDDARVLVNPGEGYTNPDGSPKGRTHIKELAPLHYERISSASKNR
jgi:Bacterial Ig-like domain/FG-GAP-like repeat